MKSLHLIKTSFGAGWALRQIRELSKLGIEVHVALPGNGPMVGQYTEAGATEHFLQSDFPIRTPWTFPTLAGRFRKLVDQVQPDIIHSHFVGTTLTMRFALGNRYAIPRVFQVPGPLHLEHLLFRISEIASAGPTDYWIGSCQWTCERYRIAGVSPNRVFLSYYGGDLGQLSMGPQGKLRSELGLMPNCKIIGMVSYIYAPKRHLGQTRGLKGHEDLIDAIKICLEVAPNIICVMIGGAWDNATSYEKKVRAYAYERCGDRVIFLGNRNDVPDLYADMDVAVHPSHSENVGGAGESLALAVPTIATNVGGFPDVVIDGETGWLVPPRSPEMLAKAIKEALAGPEEAHMRATKGQKLARELFDIKKTATEIKSIYEHILGSAC